MDIVRAHKPGRLARRTAILAGGGIILAIAVLTLGLRLKPAAPSVDRSSVLIDTVRRGPLVRRAPAPRPFSAQAVALDSAPNPGPLAHARRVSPRPRRPPTRPLLAVQPLLATA